MKTLKISHSQILILIVVSAFFLVSMSVCGAKESTSLQKSPFVNVEILDPKYDHVYETEMVKNGSEVSIKVVLTNFSREIEKSTLSFYSELEKSGGHISMDGEKEALKSDGSYAVEHKKVEKEVMVSWSGTAPEVRKQETFILLNITQETTEGKYIVVAIKGDVTSEIINDALNAWYIATEEIEKANRTIANATKAGIDVGEAQTNLVLANVHLNNSRERYNAGKPGDAFEEAKKASASAKVAEEKARATIGFTKYSRNTILVAVVVIAIVAFVFWYKMRERKRGIY